jgi:hypothetical protein
MHPRRVHLLLYPDYIVTESTVGVLVGQCRADRGSPCTPISAAAPPHLLEHLRTVRSDSWVSRPNRRSGECPLLIQ